MRPGCDQVLNSGLRALLVLAALTLVLNFTQGASYTAAEKELLNINSASQAELEAVKGIGPAKAQKIMANRPYQSLDELNKAGLSTNQIKELALLFTAKPVQSPSAPATAPKAKKTSEAEPIGKPKTATVTKEKKEVPKLAPGQRVNLNTASQDELELLPGIGPAKAKAIIKGRPYKSPEDIMKIKGIKEGTYKKLKEFIIVK